MSSPGSQVTPGELPTPSPECPAALATKLADGGAEVWIADRQVGPAEELAHRLNSGGGNAHAIELDVRSYPSFVRAIAKAVQHSEPIDYLFNNAGIAIAGEIDSYTIDGWNNVFDVNLRGGDDQAHAKARRARPAKALAFFGTDR